MEKEMTGSGKTGAAEMTENAGEKDYLDSLIDKMEVLGLADESYVNQFCDRLEPILGEE